MSSSDSGPGPVGPHPPGPAAPDPSRLPVTVPVETARPRGAGPPTSALYLALFLVAVLAGSALFASGYSLGRQQAVTGGTGGDLQEQFRPFWSAYQKIVTEYVGEVDRAALVEGAISGMFESLADPYSHYLTAEEYQKSLADLSGQFEGIGAEMQTRDPKGAPGCGPLGPKCAVVVVRTMRGSPARKKGLQPGDEVVAIDGQPVAGKTLEDTVARVRGKRGTTVVLTIVRHGGKPFEVPIVRDVIQTEDVESRIIGDGLVGYVRIDGFSAKAAEDLKARLAEFVGEKRLTKIIVDLRDNSGGFIDQAQSIASHFVASGPIFWQEFAGGRRIAHDAEPGGVATDPRIELVVLVNGGTASASEIVAGAVQDTGRGRLVGERTYGKGTVQQFSELDNGGGYRLSIAKWLTPRERWIHGKGLQPDVVVTVPEAAADGEDRQLDRAVELLLGAGEAKTRQALGLAA